MKLVHVKMARVITFNEMKLMMGLSQVGFDLR